MEKWLKVRTASHFARTFSDKSARKSDISGSRKHMEEILEGLNYFQM